MEFLDQLYQQFQAFGGVGIAVALVVTLLKLLTIITKGKIVIIPDGWSGNIAAILNVVLFSVFVFGKIFYPNYDFPGLDENIRVYAGYGEKIIGLLLQILGTVGGYKILKLATPAVSYSAMGITTK